MQSGHSGKAHWRPTRLDTRLRSAGARGTLTSGDQAEKRRCFSRRSPARETKGNAADGAKRQRGHGHFMQTTTRSGPETLGQGVMFWRRETEARCHRKGLARKRVEEGGLSEEEGGWREEEGRREKDSGCWWCARANFFTWQKYCHTLPPPAMAWFAESQAAERRGCEPRSESKASVTAASSSCRLKSAAAWGRKRKAEQRLRLTCRRRQG